MNAGQSTAFELGAEATSPDSPVSGERADRRRRSGWRPTGDRREGCPRETGDRARETGKLSSSGSGARAAARREETRAE